MASKTAKYIFALSPLVLLPALFFSSRTLDLEKWLSSVLLPVEQELPLPVIPYSCEAQKYSTEIVSLDPLVLYINNFVHNEEIKEMLDAVNGTFASSKVSLGARKQTASSRTSQSAGLPKNLSITQCVGDRALDFMGTALHEGDDIGTIQLVKYATGEQFKNHHDWFPTRQRSTDGRAFNRLASFFVYLDDNCTDCGTHFPQLEVPPPLGKRDDSKYYAHPDGGLVFPPIKGNAVFWMNLFSNGTGDKRTLHAGLPLEEGSKIGMNIWVRKFFG